MEFWLQPLKWILWLKVRLSNWTILKRSGKDCSLEATWQSGSYTKALDKNVGDSKIASFVEEPVYCDQGVKCRSKYWMGLFSSYRKGKLVNIVFKINKIKKFSFKLFFWQQISAFHIFIRVCFSHTTQVCTFGLTNKNYRDEFSNH